MGGLWGQQSQQENGNTWQRKEASNRKPGTKIVSDQGCSAGKGSMDLKEQLSGQSRVTVRQVGEVGIWRVTAHAPPKRGGIVVGLEAAQHGGAEDLEEERAGQMGDM